MLQVEVAARMQEVRLVDGAIGLCLRKLLTGDLVGVRESRNPGQPGSL